MTEEQKRAAVEKYARSMGVEWGEKKGVLDVPVRPLAVEIPKAIPQSESKTITAVLYGDTHFPFADPRALEIVGQVVSLIKPNMIIHMGDLLDCYPLSRFDKNPNRLYTLQDEINMGRAHLAQMRMRAPSAKFIFLEGNHCDRLRRTMWNTEGPQAALMQLTDVQEALTWPRLLGLEELGIEFFAYDQQTKQRFLPKWLLKHGTVVRQYSGYTARGEMEKYNCSGSSGHTHRLGVYFRRDYNGNHCWTETGCTCLLTPEYMDDPNWQQGCVVVTFEPETGAFQAEPIYVYHGLAVCRGHILRA